MCQCVVCYGCVKDAQHSGRNMWCGAVLSRLTADTVGRIRLPRSGGEAGRLVFGNMAVLMILCRRVSVIMRYVFIKRQDTHLIFSHSSGNDIQFITRCEEDHL